MGYGVRLEKAEFAISSQGEARAVQDLGYGDREAMEQALRETGWAIHRKEDGTIDGIGYAQRFLSPEFNDVLKALGPYVTEGSVIELRGEDGDVCRWEFDGRRCTFHDFKGNEDETEIGAGGGRS